jgi:hypothetical protein
MGSNFLRHPGSVTIKHVVFAALTFLASQFALIDSASAEFIPPNEVKVKTETLKPEHPQSEFGTYTYDIDWQGIPVATATVTVRPAECSESDPRCLKVRATAKSARGIDIFYRMRHLSESTFREGTLQPISFVQKQIENSALREARISWRPDGTVKSHFKKKKDPYDLEFSPNNPMFDPISAAFYAKSVPLSVDSSVDVDVFNGRNRFVITFTVVGKEKVTVGEKSVEAFKIVPRVKKLTDTEGEKKFRSGVIWISDDEKREVLKMESEVFIGTVGAELAKFEPVETPGQQPRLPAPESELAAVKARIESAGRAMLEAPHR